MTIAMWGVLTFATVVSAFVLVRCWPAWRAAPPSWRALALSGIPLGLGGLAFAARFWVPTPGPYLANVRYPFGSHLNAWAVSFGFLWLAFGLLFFVAASLLPRTAQVWCFLLAAWVLSWLPHMVIAIAVAAAGGNTESVNTYRDWGSNLTGAIVLIRSALILALHFGLSVAGFVLTARELWRAAGRRPSSER